jgi:dTDP-4-amino-4,6-dideoxygalactose transaminase
MDWNVPLFNVELGPAEAEALSGVIRSKWLTMGALTGEFEARFAALAGTKHAVALSSCTAALHIALATVGVGPGDEVVVPALTFVATANAVRYCQAKPVFADVASLDFWNVSVDTLDAVATSATRAVIILHYGGWPSDMESIVAWGRRRGIAIIEDAAHAPGARYAGKSIGSWGDAGCFSFFSNKNLTTGEGGMLTTDRDDIVERARRFRSHGMTTLTLDRYKGHAFSYDVVDLGYNYRMSELNAALGLVQLDALSQRNRRRALLVSRYRAALANVPGIHVPFGTAPGEPAWHLMPVLLPAAADRARIMSAMKAGGVQTSIHYLPVNTFTAYQQLEPSSSPHLKNTHAIGARTLTLPLYPSMTEEQLDYVCNTLLRAVVAA